MKVMHEAGVKGRRWIVSAGLTKRAENRRPWLTDLDRLGWRCLVFPTKDFATIGLRGAACIKHTWVYSTNSTNSSDKFRTDQVRIRTSWVPPPRPRSLIDGSCLPLDSFYRILILIYLAAGPAFIPDHDEGKPHTHRDHTTTSTYTSLSIHGRRSLILRGPPYKPTRYKEGSSRGSSPRA